MSMCASPVHTILGFTSLISFKDSRLLLTQQYGLFIYEHRLSASLQETDGFEHAMLRAVDDVLHFDFKVMDGK